MKTRLSWPLIGQIGPSGANCLLAILYRLSISGRNTSLAVTEARIRMDPTNKSVLNIFRAKATRYALFGTLIAAGAVIIATLLLCLIVYDGINLTNIGRAHRENVALWMLDALPFLYAFWGQYASMKMARAAGSMVHSRTRSLRQELEQARYTTQTKTDFFARMSHELRTPINAIIGMSELLMDGGLNNRHQSHAQVIHESAHGLLNLINDVLDFSKIEAGRMELDEVEFDLQDTLKSAAILLAQQADKKGLRLVTLIPPGTPRRVMGDPGRIRQIVLNLLGNAIKYTREGEVVLSLKGWQKNDDNGLRFDIEVADTGIGISTADQERLFRPYEQARGQTGRRDSTGLGLSITKELVEAMGGEISVSSEPGKGSVFRFNMLLQRAQESHSSELAATINLRGTRALLVEPTSVARETLAAQLRTLGIRLTLANDGVEALDIVQRSVTEGTPFDIVFTDIFLPRLSGEELGRELKSRPATRDICLAVVTAAGARGDAKRFNDCGFAGYLSRPIPPEYLHELIAAILATRNLSEQERHDKGLVTKYHIQSELEPENKPILLVDDSEIAVEISCNMLGRLGYQVEVATTGDEALTMIKEGDYGLVLSDLRLPDREGAELIEQIRALDSSRRQTPIVMLSASNNQADKRLCLEAGADGWLSKPVGTEVLRSTIERHMCITTASVDAEEADEASIRAANDTIETQALPDSRMVEIFLAETRRRLDEMRTALSAEHMDIESIARHAHTLKGSSQHFEAGHVPIMADRIEKVARAGDGHRVREYFPLLEKACELLAKQLEAAVEKKVSEPVTA
jgi:two-component system, sensor histidine kinase and response regulator